jgi:hypothetical protein
MGVFDFQRVDDMARVGSQFDGYCFARHIYDCVTLFWLDGMAVDGKHT